jgi:DnaJ-class molecular chaperone
MSTLTFYELLEVSLTSTEKDIKKAGKKMLLKWHPDKNLDDQENASIKFKEIHHAIEILTDPIRRKEYDLTLATVRPTIINGSVTSPFIGSAKTGIHIHDLLGKRHIEYTIYVPYPPPLITTFTYPRDITCTHCICKSCNGTGLINVTQLVYDVNVVHQTACTVCKLYQHHNKCKRCKGTHRIVSSHTMTTRLPSHCKNGTQLYFPNEGHQFADGNTNLILTVKMTT